MMLHLWEKEYVHGFAVSTLWIFTTACITSCILLYLHSCTLDLCRLKEVISSRVDVYLLHHHQVSFYYHNYYSKLYKMQLSFQGPLVLET